MEWLQNLFHIVSIGTKIDPKTASRSIINLARWRRLTTRFGTLDLFGPRSGRLRNLLGQRIPLEADYRPLLDLHDGAIWTIKSARGVLEITWRRTGTSRRVLRAFLRRLRPLLEASRAVLEAFGGIFGMSLSRLGIVWRHLGRELGKYFFGLVGRVSSFADFRKSFDNHGFFSVSFESKSKRS